jgi:hypothetical protein
MILRCSSLFIVGLAAGCSGAKAGQAEPQDCAPVPTDLPAEASADRMAGEYHLRMVATSGPKNGSSADGRLRLLPQDSSLRQLTFPGGMRDTSSTAPLYGTAEIDMSPVGAVYAGDLSSLDPTRPGVVVLQSSSGSAGGSRVMLRMGSEANRRDRLRFDGAYTVLRVRRISEDGFAGNWESGVPLPRSGGHFCATKAGTGEK